MKHISSVNGLQQVTTNYELKETEIYSLSPRGQKIEFLVSRAVSPPVTPGEN